MPNSFAWSLSHHMKRHGKAINKIIMSAIRKAAQLAEEQINAAYSLCKKDLPCIYLVLNILKTLLFGQPAMPAFNHAETPIAR